MTEAAFIEDDCVLVIAGQVVGVTELKESAGMARVELDGTFQVTNGAAALAFLKKEASDLEMIFGIVAGLVFQLVEQATGLVVLALEAQYARPLELHLAGGVTRFLSLF